MDITAYQLTPFVTNCFVVEDHGEAMVIDPGEASAVLLSHIEDLDVVLIVNTHTHIDHCGGNAGLSEATGAPLACHEDDLPLLRSLEQQAAMFGVGAGASPEPDRLLFDGDTISVGNEVIDDTASMSHEYNAHAAVASLSDNSAYLFFWHLSSVCRVTTHQKDLTHAFGILQESGVANESKSTRTLMFPGGVSSAHSGLIPGRKYYLDDDGTLTLEANDRFIGFSIDETRLLIVQNDYTGETPA